MTAAEDQKRGLTEGAPADEHEHEHDTDRLQTHHMQLHTNVRDELEEARSDDKTEKESTEAKEDDDADEEEDDFVSVEGEHGAGDDAVV